MERAIKVGICLMGLFFTSASFAAFFEPWHVQPNMGVDVGVRKQAFDPGFGEEHFREHYPDTNVYVGARIYDYFGVEAGYEHMYRQEKRQFYGVDQPVLGFINPIAALNQKLYISDALMHGWHLSVLGFWPICEKTGTDFTALIGIAWLKMAYNITQIEDANAATPIVAWQSDTKALARVGVGIRQMITYHFGARLQAIWENTSRLNASIAVPIGQGGEAVPILPSDFYTVKPKNSRMIQLGFFFELD